MRIGRKIKVFLWVMAGSFLLLTSCGPGGGAQEEWVYVPEFISIDGGDVSFAYVQAAGNSVYFLSRGICRYSVEDGVLSPVSLDWQGGGTDRAIEEFFAAEDGSIYLTAEEGAGRHMLYKFDALGNQVYSQDVTGLRGDSRCRLAADPNGRLYLGSGPSVWLFDETGKGQGKISLGEEGTGVAGVGCGRDGKMYAAFFGNDKNQGFDGLGNIALAELDFDHGKVGITYPDISLGDNDGLVPGMEQDFLLFDTAGVYEYRLADQTKEMVFGWLDCDIDASFVEYVGRLADGRLAVVYEDWLNDDRGIALLTKTEKSRIVQKETIVVATLYSNSWLQAAAVDFNRNSDKYKVVVRQFAEEGEGGADALQDAVVDLKNALASEECPDIIDLSELDMEQLAAAGVLEDLAPYLEKSSMLSRDDFLESILDAYTIDGSLVTIPLKVNVRTVVGSQARMGRESGWTLDEMMGFAGRYPESDLFGSIEKREILQSFMLFGKDAFMDWRTGQCTFDSGQFKKLLRFVDGLPDTPKQNQAVMPGPAIDAAWQVGDTLPDPVRIQKGEVLLDIEDMFNFDAVQMCKEMFRGDIVCMGFPTPDGTGGHAALPIHAYGITARSDRKEGAWEFIESFLLQEESGRGSEFGFPVRKTELEAMAARALNAGYLPDENGAPLLDEEGNPMEDPEWTPASGSKGGWQYTYRRATREEVDCMLAVLQDVRRVPGDNDEVTNIICEEADGYFAGQKTLDDVAEVIQSRVSLYMEENR